MEDSQLTPFFSSTFSALFITFLYLKIAKIHFLVIPPLVHVDLKKYLNFGQKLLIRTAHHTLLESRHPQVTKNPYYILAPVVGQKKVSVFGLEVESTILKGLPIVRSCQRRKSGSLSFVNKTCLAKFWLIKSF